MLNHKSATNRIYSVFWIITLFFVWANQSLTSGLLPLGILSFELMWTDIKAATVIASLTRDQTLLASFSLGLDYLYIPVYCFCLWHFIGKPQGWLLRAVYFTGLLDMVENACLMTYIIESPDGIIFLASLSAVAKFSFIILLVSFGIQQKLKSKII